MIHLMRLIIGSIIVAFVGVSVLLTILLVSRHGAWIGDHALLILATIPVVYIVGYFVDKP